MNGVYFATETYRTGFQKKDQGEDGDSLEMERDKIEIFFRTKFAPMILNVKVVVVQLPWQLASRLTLIYM